MLRILYQDLMHVRFFLEARCWRIGPSVVTDTLAARGAHTAAAARAPTAIVLVHLVLLMMHLVTLQQPAVLGATAAHLRDVTKQITGAALAKIEGSSFEYSRGSFTGLQ